jgi:hypothetical protein
MNLTSLRQHHLQYNDKDLNCQKILKGYPMLMLQANLVVLGPRHTQAFAQEG